MQLVGSLLRGLVAEKVRLHSGAQAYEKLVCRKVMFTHFHPSRWAAFFWSRCFSSFRFTFPVCGRFLFGKLSVQIVEKRRLHVRFAASYCQRSRGDCTWSECLCQRARQVCQRQGCERFSGHLVVGKVTRRSGPLLLVEARRASSGDQRSTE